MSAPVIDHGKRRRVLWFQKWTLNWQTKPLAWLGLLPRHVLLETTGHRTGKRRRTIVGAHRDGDRWWVVAEQGHHAGWVRNLDAGSTLRVRHRGRWHAAVATMLDDDDASARLSSWRRPVHAGLVRAAGTDLLTVAIDRS